MTERGLTRLENSEGAPPGCPELIMPLHHRDIGTSTRTLGCVRDNLSPKTINVITSRDSANDPLLAGCAVLDEDDIVPGMTLASIKEELSNRNLLGLRAPGWLLQQFLKLGYSRHTSESEFVVWDSDTLPLKPYSFYDQATGKPVLWGKTENFPPYFEMNSRLLGLERRQDLPSFVAEVMLFRTDLVRAMLDEIEHSTCLPFWKGILAKMDATSIPAEFELYGNYVSQRHPNQYIIRSANSFRYAAKLVGLHPSTEQLEWLAKDFDVISLESYHERRIFSNLTRRKMVRRMIRPRPLCNAFNTMAAPLVKTTWTGRRYFYF